jgi:hypothetical protein
MLIGEHVYRYGRMNRNKNKGTGRRGQQEKSTDGDRDALEDAEEDSQSGFKAPQKAETHGASDLGEDSR